MGSIPTFINLQPFPSRPEGVSKYHPTSFPYLLEEIYKNIELCRPISNDTIKKVRLLCNKILKQVQEHENQNIATKFHKPLHTGEEESDFSDLDLDSEEIDAELKALESDNIDLKPVMMSLNREFFEDSRKDSKN